MAPKTNRVWRTTRARTLGHSPLRPQSNAPFGDAGGKLTSLLQHCHLLRLASAMQRLLCTVGILLHPTAAHGLADVTGTSPYCCTTAHLRAVC